MLPSPYRSPAEREPSPPATVPPVSYEIVGAAGLAWALGMMRVAIALTQGEPASRELDLAWLLVFLAPVVLWRELVVLRRR
jgi:hypothetical protein